MADADPRDNDTEYFFNLAIDQRVDFNVFFLLDHCEISEVRAPCVMLKNRHFVLRADLKEIANHPIIWGAAASCYFSVWDVETIHCHCMSRIVRLYNGPADSMYLIFPMPKHVDHNQRRFARRVELDPEIAGKFGLWQGTMDYFDRDNLPKFKWQPLEKYECEFGELSASGLRLDVPETVDLAGRLNINDLILLKGDFGTPAKPFPLYALATIVRKMPQPDNGEIISFGCQFQSWRGVDPANGQGWFRVVPLEGIGRIAQWISRNFRSLAL